MKTFRTILAAALLSLLCLCAFCAEKPPVALTQARYYEAVGFFDHHDFDASEEVFKQVVADSYKIDELLEIRLKSIQYLGFIDRERHDYEHSNKWFRAASVVLNQFGNPDQKLRWGKVIANEMHTNRMVIESEREQESMRQEYRKKELYMLSVLLFLSLIGMVTFIVLFTNLKRAYIQLAARNSEWAAPQEAPAQDENPLRRRILDYIEGEKAYLNPGLSLEDVCRATGSNRSYVSAEMNAMSTNFKTFINEYRIKEAVRMLAEQPDLCIDEVMERSGFNAKTTFYTAFKEATGMSPAAFRKVNQTK